MDTPDRSPAESFGAYVRQLAQDAGYDPTPGSGGRARLAEKINMSKSAVGRMLDGKTLPMPQQFEPLARAFNVDVRELLVHGAVISATSWPESSHKHVRSATARSPLTPQDAADAWGITHPIIRRMLITSIEEAIRLQQEAADPPAAASGAS